jgi:hypothetical protein
VPRARSLAAVPENAPILAWLRATAEPAASEYRLGVWELHAHPDLCERLDEVAPDGGRVELYGVPGRASSRGVVYAVARGIDSILLRLAAGEVSDAVLANGGSPAADVGSEWVVANAWLTNVPRAAGTDLLRSWLEAARNAADA